MSYYGISQIKWDPSHSFVEQAKVHGFIKSRDGSLGFDMGTAMQYYEVSDLIKSGDKVYVLIPDGPGSYKLADLIGVQPGKNEYLVSVDEHGMETVDLYNLPAWQ